MKPKKGRKKGEDPEVSIGGWNTGVAGVEKGTQMRTQAGGPARHSAALYRSDVGLSSLVISFRICSSVKEPPREICSLLSTAAM